MKDLWISAGELLYLLSDAPKIFQNYFNYDANGRRKRNALSDLKAKLQASNLSPKYIACAGLDKDYSTQ